MFKPLNSHLDGLGEPLWLIVVLDAHTESVDQDAEEDEPLKHPVVDERLEVALARREELHDAAEARLELVQLLGSHGKLVVLLAAHLVDAPGPSVVPVHALGQVVRRTVLHLAGVEPDLGGEAR